MSNTPAIRVGLDALGLQDNQHLKNSLINCDDPLKAISDFQEENSILLPTLKPALNLLDLHNVKRLDFHLSIADELKEQVMKRVEELATSINSAHSSNASSSHKENLTAQNNEDVRKLEELLEKSFPLILMPRLTPLIIQIMKGLPKISDQYLQFFNDNEHLYSMAPIEVKRQIWSFNTDVFLREIQPLFDKFINHFEELFTNSELTGLITTTQQPTLNLNNIDIPVLFSNLLLTSTAYTFHFKGQKKHLTYITEIAKLIGNSHKLYQFTMNTLSSLYIKTRNWFYSTIRSQLMHKFNELYHHENLNSIVISESNPENVFKFANIINNCLREKRLEAKRAKELEVIMESKKFEKILANAAFVLADPFVVDMLSRNAMSLLNKCVQNELLPRNCTELIFVLRLLSLSLLAWEIMDGQSNKEPTLDGGLITEYLPNLAYFITDYYEKLYDDSIASLANPTQTTPTASLLVTSPTVLSTVPTTPTSSLPASNQQAIKTSPPIVLKISTKKLEIIASIKAQIAENELCSVLLTYLIIVCVEISDWVNLKVLLPALKYPNNNSVFFEKWFLYHFINMLCDKNTIEQFKHDWFVQLIIDEFLYTTLQQKENQPQALNTASTNSISPNSIYELVYKLIEKIYPSHLSPVNFRRVIELFKPKKSQSSSIHIIYLKLKNQD